MPLWLLAMLLLFLLRLPNCPPANLRHAHFHRALQMKDGWRAKEDLVDRVVALFRTKVFRPGG